MESLGYTFGEEINTAKASYLSKYYFHPGFDSQKVKTMETGRVQAFKNVKNDFDGKPSQKMPALTLRAKSLHLLKKNKQPSNHETLPSTNNPTTQTSTSTSNPTTQISVISATIPTSQTTVLSATTPTSHIPSTHTPIHLFTDPTSRELKMMLSNSKQ